MRLQHFFNELKRRDVFRIATAYGVTAWLITQIVVSVFPYLGISDFWITAIIVLLLLGFPVAIIVGWVFEITPDGIKKTDEVELTEEEEAQTEKKLNVIIISFLSVTLLLLLVERIFFADSALIERDGLAAQSASIAVLPFVDMSSEQDQEYFSDGLSEELLNSLAKVQKLKVAGRTSSFKFKGQNENLTKIGKELNVGYILEGSVRKSGSRLRITAQLINVDDGYHLWSETYDRELTIDDIFDIQEEISLKVTEVLKITLLPIEQDAITLQSTGDIEAYNLFLEGTQLMVSLQAEDTEKAIEKFKNAIKIDPGFAEAYARLAICYINLNEYGNITLDDAKYLARENIDKALLLNGNLGRAFEALGYFNLMIYDDEGALDAFERASELLPNDPEVFDGLHLALEYLGNYEEANEALRKAYVQDPLNPNFGSSYANHLVYDGVKLGEASHIFDKMLEVNPDYTLTYMYKADMLRDTPFGKLDEAFEIVYSGYKNMPNDLVLLRTLGNLARDLDLMPIAEFAEKRFGELYPDNDEYVWAQIYNSYQKGDFSVTEALLKQVIEEVGAESVDDHSMYLSRIYYMQNKYEEALRLVEDVYPEFFDDTLLVDDGNFKRLINLSFMLQKSGKAEEARITADAACSYADEQVARAATERVKSWYLWGVGECQIYRGEHEAAITTYSDLYFQQHSKMNIPEYFNYGLETKSLQNDDNYLALKARVMEDIHAMRARVILNLKEQGDWKEEWEIGN